ncbi:hypothetical protein [Hyalangium versicolor]|uniref:hypothetical protein n=1 Tax=Hyalangium versicolor TaxID=2861190 RepID=UPI001CCB2448|nr:hypothetical protein [Hyalangium versicolor]
MQVLPPLQSIQAHKGAIWSICAFPSGLLVTAGGDGMLKSWKVEARTGRFLLLAEVTTPHSEVLLVRPSPRGVLLSAGHEGGIAVWEIEPVSGKLEQRQQLELPDDRNHYNDRMLETHSGYLLAWASGTAGRPALSRWSETERGFFFLQQLPIERASTFLELPDGSLLSGDSTGQICSWRPDTSSEGWEKTGTLQAHEGPLYALANLQNGDLLSAGGHEPQLKVWRAHPFAEKWELVQVLNEHHSQIVEVMNGGPEELLSADRGDRSVLGWRRHPEVLVWIMATDKSVLLQRQNGRLRGCIDGALLLEDDGASALSLWRKSEGAYKRTLVFNENRRGNLSVFVSLPEGMLITGGWDGRLISWRLGAGALTP